MNKNVIILSRMYVGKYLESNIGHEVINLFKDDNGDNYVYISDDGRINPSYNDSVKAVLLIRYVEPSVMEIIAKAEELEQILYKSTIEDESRAQIEFCDKNDVTYGGVRLYKIQGNTAAEKIVITFKSHLLRKVKNPVYLIEDKTIADTYRANGERVCYLPQKHFSSQSLKMYYPEDKFPDDYAELQKALSDSSLWEDKNTTEPLEISKYNNSGIHRSFLSVINKEYDELVFSNFLAYIFDQDHALFLSFAKEVLGISDMDADYDIKRESENHIDIWIECSKSILVIENKIKSKINGERHDIHGDYIQSQLSEYYEHASAKAKSGGKSVRCFLFTPDYNPINLEKYAAGKQYTVVYYSKIYEFYYNNAGRMLHIEYFRDFIDAIAIHTKTVDNSNFEIMRERFITKIQKLREIEREQRKDQ